MTISTTTSRASYNGNGVTTVFAVPFRFFANSDLVVQLVTISTGASTTLTLTTHYTVTGADDEDGGSLTMVTAPAVGQRLVIRRVIPATQEVDYIAGDPFPAETHERALDRLTMLAQQAEEVDSRSLTFPSGDTTSGELPAVTARASRLLGFDAEGRLAVSAPASGTAADLALDLASASGAGMVGLADGRTVQEAFETVICVTTFGARCDWNGTTGTDDTVAIQAAIDYANANGHSVRIPRMALVTQLFIDRPVDAAASDHYFNIYGPGGLYKAGAGGMFSSRIPYNGVNAVSQCIRFQGLAFEGSSSGLAIYAMDGARYLRTRWDDCSFRRIRLFTTTTGEVQSLYLSRCQMRRWEDWFIQSENVTLDCHMHQCLMEAGGRGVRWELPVGCSIIQSNIEGMFYHAIEYTAGYGFAIRDCYFEFNGYGAGQDGASIVQTGGGALGVIIDGNYFSAAHTTNPQILWQFAKGCKSSNNHLATSGSLHGFTAESFVDIDGDVAELGTLIDGDPSYMTGLNRVQSIGKFIRSDNPTYGATVRAKFISGRGGVLELRTVQAGVERTTGIDLLESGTARIQAARIALSVSDVPENNGDLIFQATSNTQLTLKYKGSDGVVRSVNLTLA